MKNNKIRFFIYATSIIGVAFFASYQLYTYSSTWHDAPPNQCDGINSSLKNISPALYQIGNCTRLGWSQRYYIEANKNVEMGSPPISLWIVKSDKVITKTVVIVQGGPGAASLSPPISGFKRFWEIAEQCNAVIITPNYSGSYERSNYPASSHENAEREVGKLISDLSASGKVKISIIADSLGANIISSPQVMIPSGNHILLVPLLKSPRDGMDYYTSGSAPPVEKVFASARSQTYIIKEGSKNITKLIPVMSFIKAYFGNDATYLNETFMDRWVKKQNINLGAKIHAVIARDDHKAGGANYAPSLNKLGFTTEIVEGNHDQVDKKPNRFDRALVRFKSQICED